MDPLRLSVENVKSSQIDARKRRFGDQRSAPQDGASGLLQAVLTAKDDSGNLLFKTATRTGS